MSRIDVLYFVIKELDSLYTNYHLEKIEINKNGTGFLTAKLEDGERQTYLILNAPQRLEPLQN